MIIEKGETLSASRNSEMKSSNSEAETSCDYNRNCHKCEHGAKRTLNE